MKEENLVQPLVKVMAASSLGSLASIYMMK